MKRGIIAAVLITIVFACAFFGDKMLASKTEALIEAAHTVYENPNEYDGFKKLWDKNKTAYALLIDHEYFEDIGLNIDALGLIEQENFKTKCASIIAELEELKEHISFTSKSLF